MLIHEMEQVLHHLSTPVRGVWCMDTETNRPGNPESDTLRTIQVGDQRQGLCDTS